MTGLVANSVAQYRNARFGEPLPKASSPINYFAIGLAAVAAAKRREQERMDAAEAKAIAAQRREEAEAIAAFRRKSERMFDEAKRARKQAKNARHAQNKETARHENRARSASSGKQ